MFLTRMISDICCVVYFSYILQTRPYGLRQCKIYETILADVSEITLPSDNITLLDSFYSLISLHFIIPSKSENHLIILFKIQKIQENYYLEKGTLERSVLRRCFLAPYVPLPAEGSASVPLTNNNFLWINIGE